jgi:hypothetical protein
MAQSDDRDVEPIRVYLEYGQRRTFAMTVDWPGWGRSGRTDEAALEALDAHRDRYAPIARAGRARLPRRPAAGDRYTVIERVPGNATTEFGAPGVVPALDRAADVLPWTGPVARRQVALLRAAWARLDQVVGSAPAQLRKGPRGGGRDRDKIVEHVLGAEPAYVRKAGLKLPAPTDRAGLDALREALVDHLLVLAGTTNGPTGGSGDDRGEDRAGARATAAWPPGYVVRRIAWHALDHAWEIEDRS